jgi:hypothetical protein
MTTIEHIAWILLVNVLFYWRSIYYNYVSDDIPVHIKSRGMKYKNNLQKRWLQLLGEVRISQKQDHLLTLTIHALICVFIYIAFGKSNISFIAALLFTFNPMNNQCSVWIAGRGYTIPALCILIALSFPVLAPLALFASTSFTVGFVVPIAAIGTPNRIVLLWLLVVWAIHWRKFYRAVKYKHKAETVDEDKKFHAKKIIMAVKTVGFYMVSSLVPYRITFYHNFLQSCAGNTLMKAKAYRCDQYFLAGFIGILGFALYAIFVPWSISHYGLLWFFIAIAPFSNLSRTNQEIADRFCYIANIGLMVWLASVLPANIAYVWVALYAGVMWTVMPMYRDDYWIVEFAVANDPHAWYAWHVRAMKRWETHSFKEALILWVMAKMISPKEFKLLFNIAVVLRILKNIKESDEFLKLAEENIIPGQEELSKNVIENLRAGRATMIN